MKMLTTFVLLCAVMVLTNAAAVPEAEPDQMTGEASIQEDDGVVFSGWCPRGWTYFNNRCYRFIATAQPWALAERKCRELRGNLASIHNYDEDIFVKGLIEMASHSSPPTWIGGSDAQNEGLWLWSDSSYFGFSNWCPREPSNGGGEQHCIQMFYGGDPCWHDLSCYERRPFVCVRRR